MPNVTIVDDSLVPLGTAGNPLATTVGTAGGTQTVIPVPSATLTTAQVIVPATANGIAILASNANRRGATITNTGNQTVFIRQAATGVTVANGAALPPGASLNIDSPLYTGAIGGIVAAGTCVVTTSEYTA